MTIKFIYIQYIYIYNLYIFVNNPQGHRKGWDLGGGVGPGGRGGTWGEGWDLRGGGHDLLYFLALIFCQFKLLLLEIALKKKKMLF